MMLNICVETNLEPRIIFFQDSLINTDLKQQHLLWIINIFTVTFDQFKVSLLNKKNISF